MDYFFHFSESHSAVSLDLWSAAFVPIGQRIQAKPFGVLMLSENRQHTTYITDSFAQSCDAYAREHYFKPGFLDKFLRESNGARRSLVELCTRASRTDFSNATNSELAAWLGKYRDGFVSVGMLFEMSQAEFTQCVHDELKQRLTSLFGAQADAALSDLLAPDALDVIKREELGLMQIALDGITPQVLDAHANEYAILFFNSYDRAKNRAYLHDRAEAYARLGAPAIHAKMNELTENVLKARGKRDAWLSRISGDDTQRYARLLQALGFDRLELKDAWSGAEFRFLAVFEQVAKRLALPLEDVLGVYRMDELIAMLNGAPALSAEQKAERRTFYAFFIHNDGREFASGAAAKAKAAALVPHHFEVKPVREIRGIPASTGVAKGRARVIKVIGIDELIKNLGEFQEGEVMVTSMTNPNMVVLASRASAIVTDEGGVTSHAAILSREFGIPCIVGTHKATKTIKTGDEIEVDANTGVVRILSSQTPTHTSKPSA